MPKNIITTPEQKFSDEVKKELQGAKKAKFAVGWFFISGLKELKYELDKLESLELLISPTTNSHTAETMLLAEKFDDYVKDEVTYSKTPLEKKNILEKEATTLLERTGRLKASKENAEFIVWLSQKLKEKKINIRIYTKETMHAKLYLIEKPGGKVAFMGSSNISLSGFNLNTELNIRLTKEDQLKKLNGWFKDKWSKSEDCDFTTLAGGALEKSWPLNDEVSPFLVYLRVLHDLFSIDDEEDAMDLELGDDMPKLWDFQKDAVIDAYRRLIKYDGIFLADVPGLGKTYMGAALLAHLEAEGMKAIVICPPVLQSNWNEVLDLFNCNAKVYSKGVLGKIINDDRAMQREVVLVDEAHHFRNPETDRYKDLELICEKKKVILVGATPQNLSIWDLYHQIKLFHPEETSEVLKIEPPILKEFFEEAIKERVKLDAKGKVNTPDISENLIQQLLIRRTRKNIIDQYGADKLPPFPERIGPYRIDYDIDKVYEGGIYSELNQLIDELAFTRYDIGRYIDPKGELAGGEDEQRLKVAGANLRKIMNMILFKLLESSVYAFRESVDLIARSHEIFIRAYDESGLVLAGDAADKVYKELKKEVEILDIEVPDDAYKAADFLANIRKDIEKDLIKLRQIHNLIKNITPEQDDKLQTLIARIKGEYTRVNWSKEANEPMFDKKVLIFTQYATTAEYLGRELGKHFKNVEYVSGKTGQVMTKAALFSPYSNERIIKLRGIEVNKETEINILISTELLSEGMNLQDGQVVINYELHWNPVRIIQRIGRIDRIGSKNDKIWVYNFFPQLQAEEHINVERKVKKRIEEIINRYGDDVKSISQDEAPNEKKFFQTYFEDSKALEELEPDSTSAHHRLNWLKHKENNPIDYQRAISLPNMVKCGQQNNHKGIAIYCNADGFYKLFMASKSGDITDRNDWSILSSLECKSDTKTAEFDDAYLEVIDKVREEFEKQANEDQVRKSQFMEKVKIQADSKLTKMTRKKPEAFKEHVAQVKKMIKEAKLDIKSKRELAVIIRQKHGLLDKEILDQIEVLLQRCEKLDYVKPKRKFAEVVISEEFK